MYLGGWLVGGPARELTNLKVNDINSKRIQLRIEQSKGKHDRYTILVTKTLNIKRHYFKEYKPEVYLFERQTGGNILPGVCKIFKKVLHQKRE